MSFFTLDLNLKFDFVSVFAFVSVCIVSNRKLLSIINISNNHNYGTSILKVHYKTSQNLFDLGLEYF